MNAEPSYFPKLSVHLSHVLDEIGVNERTVELRRQVSLYIENVRTIEMKCFIGLYNNKSPPDRHSMTETSLLLDTCSVYMFGSQSEGTTTLGLKSDVDMLACINNVNVIQDWAEWEQGKRNLLMLHDDTDSGYCRLQLLYDDEPRPVVHMPQEHYYNFDQCYRVILKNTRFMYADAFLGFETIQNGPARTFTNEVHGECMYDTVHAYRCKTWPTQAYRFTRRQRHGNWPSRDLIQQAMSDGVFLVPVGSKLSPTESLEWRVSYSLTERRLMFSLNLTQIKCYVILKMLIKTFITPYVDGSLSSYHCKTALFYCIEALGDEYWVEENLVQGIIKCLNLLLVWVRDEFCPHFITPESNLFAGKITKSNKDKLQVILRDMIASNGRFLLCVNTDDLGKKLQMKLEILPSSIKILESVENKYIVVDVAFRRLYFIGQLKCFMFAVISTSLGITPLIQHVHQTIGYLCNHMSQSDRFRKQAIQTFIPHLSIWLGSLMTSVSLSHNQGIPKAAVKWFRLCVKWDVSSILKVASILYCSRDLPKTEALLQYVADRYRRYNIETMCTCYDRFCILADTTQDQLYAGKYDQATLFDDCVKFTPHENHCVPTALQLEFKRSTEDEILARHVIEDFWMTLAVADSLPYLYYLQYITYSQMGKRDQQKEALQSLEQSLVEGKHYGHLETDWNLLGQCMEQEGQSEAAMSCYRTSLKIRPRRNAANWHVQNLINKTRRDGQF